jgi:peptide/nickel transport system permease protein
MQRIILRGVGRLVRVFTLVLIASVGCVVLMRYSPGYFTDAREMDAAYSHGARAKVSAMETSQGSLPRLLGMQGAGWLHGDLGRSRQYDVPVTELLHRRAQVTVRLLVRGVLCGWTVALTLAALLSARRTSKGELAIATATALLLAVPVGVLATVCLLGNFGGPVFVLALLIAVREFKLMYSLLRTSWDAPYVLHARAQGVPWHRIAHVHLLPGMRRELISLAMTSLVLSVSALVPVEVIFDQPGLGQLAWSAAMNRDLPVLSAVTALLAAFVAVAGMFSSPASAEVAQCA